MKRGCLTELSRCLRGKVGPKGERLEEDRTAFRPLPVEAFEARRVELVEANALSLVRFDRNDYSVPVAWAHHKLTAVGDVQTMRVLHGEQVGTPTPDAVQVILKGQREQPVALFSLDGRPHLGGVHVAEPDLSAYGHLLLRGFASGGVA